MSAPRRGLIAAVCAAALIAAGGGALATSSASASTTAQQPVAAEGSAAAAQADPTYTVKVGDKGSWTHPDDTPASPYIDKDGTFYFQQAHALYGASDKRQWDFFTGTNFDDAKRSSEISDAVNPTESRDKNNDTTWRCNNSPTGKESTDPPAGSSYAHKNYCDLAGVWVDPDSGDMYGLVHNEFTPNPFGDGLHYDAIDLAVSKDQGKTWNISDHVLTSPYSTKRDDKKAFPEQTYHYGDGDPRLFVDTASGYFYVYYGSRIVDQGKGGSWKAFHSHVARAPMSKKMAPDSWQKWYDGKWSEPGLGGKESNLLPVDSDNSTGYTPADKEYKPETPGKVDEQVKAGKMPGTSPLFVMDITYNAYLGAYIGEPQAVDQSGDAPQQLYVTKDLSNPKWKLLGDTGSYTNASWYRWFLDSKNKTSSTIVGKDFRSYCSFGCSDKKSSEYVNLSIETSAPAAPVESGKAYRIANGDGRVLSQVSGSSATTSRPSGDSAMESWVFTSNKDGSYRIQNSSTKQLLGVDSGSTKQRAWGTKPTVRAAGSDGPTVGQQWFVIPGKNADNSSNGTFRLVNRYSGLVIGMSADSARLAETTPARYWDASGGVGGSRKAAEQSVELTAADKGSDSQ